MRRGVKLAIRFRLIQCQGEQAPEVELIVGKQSSRTGHSGLRRSDATAMLIEIPIVTLVNQTAGTWRYRLQRTQGVFGQRQLTDAAVSRLSIRLPVACHLLRKLPGFICSFATTEFPMATAQLLVSPTCHNLFDDLYRVVAR